MATIQPKGENLRKAVKWISETRETTPNRPIQSLIEMACFKFNLSPKESEYLLQWKSDQ